MDSTALLVQGIALAFCLWAESFFPLFMDRTGRLRLVHVARNVTLGLINGLVLTLWFSALIASSAQWGTLHRFGLLHWIPLPPAAQQIAGFIAFDLWMYGWHRANHRLAFLWRFHRVHHSDPALDTSSAYRFHVGEMVISTLLRLAVIPLLGIPLKDLVLYELILQPVILFHHSNIALPEGLDRRLRTLVVSPNMHRVHHSDLPAETNSNYASIFSFWDRIWGTYRRREVISIRFGLNEFRDPRRQTLWGLLLTPAA